MDGAGDADGSSQRTAGEIGGLADGERGKGRRPAPSFSPDSGSGYFSYCSVEIYSHRALLMILQAEGYII